MGNRSASGSRSPRRLILLTGLAIAVLATVWLFRIPLFENNWGVVDPGRVYRSAQPHEELAHQIRVYQIASILNLRGGSPDDPFYADEVQTARRHGVHFYDVPLSATERPGRQELLAILDVLDHAPYPLLIHCKQGADRTGLAATLYYLMKRNEAPELARRGFSLRHAHVPLLGPEKLHEPINEYADWLRREQLPHSPERFRDWLAYRYRDSDPPGPLADRIRPGPRPLTPRRRAQLEAQALLPSTARR
ncbi:MAG: hypothetical protein KatS3mg108_1070 [Isosphaeraceae bacterium]|jgi:protein tyrosine phosphatase (PTP) superfamily phosphohydrolase (DUF442 family)|nr:MAG: hypothetical protein KatS3mg108_1070 [Isosphaeraceae bacterium]